MNKAAALLALPIAACATGPALRHRADAVKQAVQVAHEQNAETCAPTQLAVAEANLRFAQLELDQGDALRAEEHLSTAAPAAQDALERSKNCGKVTVLIREKPAQPDKPKLKDSDGDGVPDVDDLCPDMPGPAENHGCPLIADRDGDGVPDDIDRCPDVPGPHDNFGCPWADRDGDGVPDNKDACPDVPGPAENAGCPWADRDKDGVPDKDDKCPDEPGPADNEGCPRERKLIVVRRDRIELKQQIHFRQTRSAILPDSFELLDEVAQAIKDVPGVLVRIEGHTDSVGGMTKNMKLSQDRAKAVRRYLVKHGVRAKQLVATGYGATRPIASNSSRAGRALNRRVDFRIVSGESSR